MSSLSLYLIKDTSLSSATEYLTNLLSADKSSKNTEDSSFYRVYKFHQYVALQAPDTLPQPLLASKISQDLETTVIVFGRESGTNSQYFAEFQSGKLTKYLIYTDFIQAFGNIRIAEIYQENIKNGYQYNQKPGFDLEKGGELELQYSSLELMAHFYNFDLFDPIPDDAEVTTINVDDEIFNNFPIIKDTWFQPSISSTIPY